MEKFKSNLLHFQNQYENKKAFFQIAVREVELYFALEGLSDLQLPEFNDFFTELQPYHSFLDCNLIKHLIINAIPDMTDELKSTAKEYSQRLQSFITSSQIFNIIKAVCKPVTKKVGSNLTFVTLKLHNDWNKMSLQNLLTVVQYFLGYKILHFNHILLASDKSLSAKFLVHEKQLEPFKALANSNKDNLVQLGIYQILISKSPLFSFEDKPVIEKELSLERVAIKAAESGNFSLLLPLFELGVSLDCTDSNKDTPLILAVKNGHSKVVQTLIALGVNIRISNGNGYTALMIAYEMRHDDIVNILQPIESRANLKDTGLSLKQKCVHVDIQEEEEEEESVQGIV